VPNKNATKQFHAFSVPIYSEWLFRINLFAVRILRKLAAIFADVALPKEQHQPKIAPSLKTRHRERLAVWRSIFDFLFA
jgi:hypothetical protein